MLFPCSFTTSFVCWIRAVATQTTTCKLNFYFLNFSSDRFINQWKIKPSNIRNCIYIYFMVLRNIFLQNSCFAVCIFLFARLVEEIHHRIPSCQVMQTLSVTLLLIFCNSQTQFTNLWMPLAVSKGMPRAHFSFVTTSEFSSIFVLRLLTVYAYSHVKQNHGVIHFSCITPELLYFLFTLCNITNNLV